MPVTDSMARTRRFRRRRFLLGAAILGVAGGGLLASRALQPARVPRLGLLAVGSREGRAPLIEGLLHGLRELGYVDGQTLLIEYRFSEGRDERLPELAAELLALGVDVIVTSGTPAAFAAKRVTSAVPVVFAGLATNPVETGLVASLARPGGNLTGITLLGAQLAGKRLELLKETLPGLSRVAVFWNPTNPTYGPVLSELEAAAPRLGLELQRVEVRAPEDFAGAFEAAVSRRAGALIGPGDPLTTNHPKLVADLGLGFRMPTLMDLREFVEAGCLLSLGANVVESYRRAAAHVDKILRGTKPGDLPVEQPAKLDVSVNLRTARALGLTIPPSVLMQVTEVIQ